MLNTITPTHLRCEYLENPLGIDTTQPRLSWLVEAVHSDQRALSQSAYQILVASHEDFLANDVGDVWDSGKISTSQSTHVPYAGQALLARQPYWWKVRLWDQQDNPSPYSPPATWEMALLSPSDWQATWIHLPVTQHTVHESDQALIAEKTALINSPYLRKLATLSQPLSKARLYVTARGLYEVSINGQRVGDALFAPGWTDYHKRIQYQTYDVTSYLQEGNNSLGAILGTGWYSGYVGFIHKDKGYHHYGTEPSLLYQLHLEYVDGSQETIISDQSWQGTTDGPIIYSDFLAGEAYDANRTLTGWDQPDYAAEQWQPVSVTTLDSTPLVSQPDLPVRLTETLKPLSVNEVTPGTYIFDMGQNLVGWVRLHVQGPANTRVQLRFVEMLNPDGTIYTTNLRSARQTDTYTLHGNGPELFEPHFTFHGFRYVEVTGYPGTPTLEALEGCVLHSDTPASGSFACSSPMVNQLQKNILWGQRGNFLSVPTDCPQRDERLGWMGDAQIFVRTACYNMDVSAFFTKWMYDVSDAQGDDGNFADVSPRIIVPNAGSPAWGDAGVIVPWTIYQMYGDKRILEQHYAAMAQWVAYIHEHNPDLLWTKQMGNNYGDWLSIAADTPKEILATAYFAYDALLMSKIAQALGKTEDADTYRALHQAISAAFCQAYVSDDGRIKGDTQTCYVVALHMQLLPEHLRPLAAQHLVANIEQKNWHLSTGFVGVGYLCPVLTQYGYPDVAYRLLHNDTFPSWGYSIKHGATTIWERWDGWTEDKGFQDPGMNSFNHYSLGSVGQWLYQYVAGIELDELHPGFERVLIHPHPHSSLDYARATYQSTHGLISSHWYRQQDGLHLEITIPANTTAQVKLPTNQPSTVLEHGKPLTNADGISHIHQDGESLLIEVGSGTYHFAVKA